MNMFARFNENPAMILQDIKETKRYGRTDARTDGQTDGRTDGQRENSIPPTNKVCGEYNKGTTILYSLRSLRTFSRPLSVFQVLFMANLIFDSPVYSSTFQLSSLCKLGLCLNNLAVQNTRLQELNHCKIQENKPYWHSVGACIK